MDNIIPLENNYSTTKLLTKDKPFIDDNSEYKLKSQFFLHLNKNRNGEGGLRTLGFFKKTSKDKPLISIVTVVYNGQKNLEQTITSVINQDYDNVEYIIIDGGSTDSTLNIIKKYAEQIDYWVSEPDSGIYNAMNKGICLCTGEFVAFLNADDWYTSHTLNHVADKMIKNNFDYIYGNIELIINNFPEKVITPNFNRFKIDMPFGHPSLFVKRIILLKLGFNEKYPIIADYDLVLQLINNNYSPFYVDMIVTNFRAGGISLTNDLDGEHFKMMREHFGMIHASYRYLIRNNNYILRSVGRLILKLRLNILVIKFIKLLKNIM